MCLEAKAQPAQLQGRRDGMPGLREAEGIVQHHTATQSSPRTLTWFRLIPKPVQFLLDSELCSSPTHKCSHCIVETE